MCSTVRGNSGGEAKTLGSHTTDPEIDLRRVGGVWRGEGECCLWYGGQGLGTAASLWVGLTQFYYCARTDNHFE